MRSEWAVAAPFASAIGQSARFRTPSDSEEGDSRAATVNRKPFDRTRTERHARCRSTSAQLLSQSELRGARHPSTASANQPSGAARGGHADGSVIGLSASCAASSTSPSATSGFPGAGGGAGRRMPATAVSQPAGQPEPGLLLRGIVKFLPPSGSARCGRGKRPPTCANPFRQSITGPVSQRATLMGLDEDGGSVRSERDRGG